VSRYDLADDKKVEHCRRNEKKGKKKRKENIKECEEQECKSRQKN